MSLNNIACESVRPKLVRGPKQKGGSEQDRLDPSEGVDAARTLEHKPRDGNCTKSERGQIVMRFGSKSRVVRPDQQDRGTDESCYSENGCECNNGPDDFPRLSQRTGARVTRSISFFQTPTSIPYTAFMPFSSAGIYSSFQTKKARRAIHVDNRPPTDGEKTNGSHVALSLTFFLARSRTG